MRAFHLFHVAGTHASEERTLTISPSLDQKYFELVKAPGQDEAWYDRLKQETKDHEGKGIYCCLLDQSEWAGSVHEFNRIQKYSGECVGEIEYTI
jgi:hypothetical protein